MAAEPLFSKLLVGLSGSIGLYSFLHYLAALRGTVAEELTTIMTQTAQRMVPPAIVSTVTHGDVFTGTWDQHGDLRLPHIDLAEGTEAFVVMPATARVLAAAAHGCADDLLTTTILAYGRPVAFVPNMNSRMWWAAPTQRNVRSLREDGHLVLDLDTSPGAALSVRGDRQDAEPGADPAAIKHLLEQLRDAAFTAAAASGGRRISSRPGG